MSLQKIRKEKGYSIKALSELSGISTRTIESIEKREREGKYETKVSTLKALARALETTIDELALETISIEIQGINKNESMEFEILSRKEIEDVIEEIDDKEVIAKTYLERLDWNFSYYVYAYLDVRDGSVHYREIQKGTHDHPYDSFYEIILFSSDEELEVTEEEMLNEEEQERYSEFDGDLLEFLGEVRHYQRLEEYITNYLSYKENIDWDNVREQLDELYRNCQG